MQTPQMGIPMRPSPTNGAAPQLNSNYMEPVAKPPPFRILKRPTPAGVAEPGPNINCAVPTTMPAPIRILQRPPPGAVAEPCLNSNCVEQGPNPEECQALVCFPSEPAAGHMCMLHIWHISAAICVQQGLHFAFAGLHWSLCIS